MLNITPPKQDKTPTSSGTPLEIPHLGAKSYPKYLTSLFSTWLITLVQTLPIVIVLLMSYHNHLPPCQHWKCSKVVLPKRRIYYPFWAPLTQHTLDLWHLTCINTNLCYPSSRLFKFCHYQESNHSLMHHQWRNIHMWHVHPSIEETWFSWTYHLNHHP